MAWSKDENATILAALNKTRPVYGTMAITQSDINDTNPANQVTVVAHPSGNDTLNPPALPVADGAGPFGGYYKIPGFIQAGEAKEVTFGTSSMIIPNAGVYILPVGWGGFRHTGTNATVAFVLGFIRGGQIFFSQRPTGDAQGITGKLSNNSGGGQFLAEAGDEIIALMASDSAGTITLGNANVTIHMLEDTTS